ncbi:hypothetical protein C5167_005827 [Papaver somniferum]|uniref:Uncharacterized protein n=1 Tax=Papaver somniferum TaxID=3469 RepID=A0A4Y7JFJ9_PAPSO|nr:hypothetical protein C5167_005827 [Papaver somniferum]
MSFIHLGKGGLRNKLLVTGIKQREPVTGKKLNLTTAVAQGHLLCFMNRYAFNQENTPLSNEESYMDNEESDVSGSDGDDASYISRFCNLRGNEFFCEVMMRHSR